MRILSRGRLPHTPRRPRGAALLFLLVALWASGGCRKGAPNYVPSEADARQALEAGLTTWQNGQPKGTIDTVSPPVEFVEPGWWKGQKLLRYEILEEEPCDDGNRWFKVRLHLQTPSGAQIAHYLVVGRSPLWVFRRDGPARSPNRDNPN
jgi:hypothetical protein